MSRTRRFLPTNFLCYPCFYTYINAKTEHIITVVSFEWSDITEFSNKSSETSVLSSKINKNKNKFCYMQRHIEFVVFYCFFSRRGPDSFFLDASSENILEMYRREQYPLVTHTIRILSQVVSITAETIRLSRTSWYEPQSL